MKTLTNYADLTKAVPESMFRLTYFAVRTPVGFRKPMIYCESGFRKQLRKATGRFYVAGHDCGNTFSLTSSLSKGFSHL